MNELKEIEIWIESHRERVFITCPENCICWDIEEVLNKHLKCSLQVKE